MKNAYLIVIGLFVSLIFISCGSHSHGHGHSHDESIGKKNEGTPKEKEAKATESSSINNDYALYIKEWRTKNKYEIADNEFEEIVEQFKKEKITGETSEQERFNIFVNLWLKSKEDRFKVTPQSHGHPH